MPHGPGHGARGVGQSHGPSNGAEIAGHSILRSVPQAGENRLLDLTELALTGADREAPAGGRRCGAGHAQHPTRVQ